MHGYQEETLSSRKLLDKSRWSSPKHNAHLLATSPYHAFHHQTKFGVSLFIFQLLHVPQFLASFYTTMSIWIVSSTHSTLAHSRSYHELPWYQHSSYVVADQTILEAKGQVNEEYVGLECNASKCRVDSRLPSAKFMWKPQLQDGNCRRNLGTESRWHRWLYVHFW